MTARNFFMASAITAAAAFVGGAPALADCTGQVNCGQPTAVLNGQQVPIWEVAYCIVGPADGEHERISCQDPRAVHITPTGNNGVCFIGTDGKAHWDYQSVVVEGHQFFNHRIDGRWQPHWIPTD